MVKYIKLERTNNLLALRLGYSLPQPYSTPIRHTDHVWITGTTEQFVCFHKNKFNWVLCKPFFSKPLFPENPDSLKKKDWTIPHPTSSPRNRKTIQIFGIKIVISQDFYLYKPGQLFAPPESKNTCRIWAGRLKKWYSTTRAHAVLKFERYVFLCWHGSFIWVIRLEWYNMSYSYV